MAALWGRLPALSLRWRLAAWVAAVMLIGTAVTFVVVYRGSGTQLRAQIDREMQNAADDLAHAIAVSRGRSPQSVVGTADRYIEQQPASYQAEARSRRKTGPKIRPARQAIPASRQRRTARDKKAKLLPPGRRRTIQTIRLGATTAPVEPRGGISSRVAPREARKEADSMAGL